VLILLHAIGRQIAQMSGLSPADVFNPGFDTTVPLLQFLYMFALAIYVISGGHRILMAGLLGTFVHSAAAGLTTPIVDATSVLVTESFTLGVGRRARHRPLLLATLVMGLIASRCRS
jgi:flagellar biosynthetic protein FliR